MVYVSQQKCFNQITNKRYNTVEHEFNITYKQNSKRALGRKADR